MIQNAKDYNEVRSSIYLNAERLRKITFNFMKQNNLAYTRDKNYVSQPTPLPQPGEEEPQRPPTKIRLKSAKDQSTPAPKPEDEAPTPAPAAATAPISGKSPVLDPEEDGYDESYEGRTFQQAQEQLALELLKYRDEGGYASSTLIDERSTNYGTATSSSSNPSTTYRLESW